jgi:uncharacterized Fe-S cluster protein YjdI
MSRVETRVTSVQRLPITPSITFVRIEEHYQVKVITHDGKCINGDSKVQRQMQHALLEPIAAYTP